ncbi:hypothetical protein R6Y90_06080, partial [Alteromonas macleodii]|nr:hypothetical protein [Alteromonas macleodii]
RTLSLANNALAIRIIFPSVRVIQVSFNLTGLPASLGKQKRVEYYSTLLNDVLTKVRYLTCT